MLHVAHQGDAAPWFCVHGLAVRIQIVLCIALGVIEQSTMIDGSGSDWSLYVLC